MLGLLHLAKWKKELRFLWGQVETKAEEGHWKLSKVGWLQFDEEQEPEGKKEEMLGLCKETLLVGLIRPELTLDLGGNTGMAEIESI